MTFWLFYPLPLPLALAAAALRDKKNHGGRLDLILPESVGRCRIQPIPPEEFGDWLTDGGVV